jgi:hypothetical protein
LALQASDSPSGPPKTGTPGGPKAVRKAVYMPGRRALAPEGTKPDAAPKHRRTDTAVAAPKHRRTDTAPKKPRSSSVTGSQQQASTDYLWADGSVDSEDGGYWNQSTVTVKTTEALTELKIVVNIAQTGGVENPDMRSSLDGKINVSTSANNRQLTYVVTLKPGVTLAPDTYVFTFQYNHAKGNRNVGGDRYEVTTKSTDSVTLSRKGRLS